MDWILKGIIAPILSGVLAWFFAVLRANQQLQAQIEALGLSGKLESLDAKIAHVASRLEEYREMSAMALAQVAADVKSATGELHAAASTIKALTETQAVVNRINAQTLERLMDRVEKLGERQADLNARVQSLGERQSDLNGRVQSLEE